MDLSTKETGIVRHPALGVTFSLASFRGRSLFWSLPTTLGFKPGSFHCSCPLEDLFEDSYAVWKPPTATTLIWLLIAGPILSGALEQRSFYQSLLVLLSLPGIITFPGLPVFVSFICFTTVGVQDGLAD